MTPNLSQLAVFVAPTVEPDVQRAAIARRLTSDAGPDSGQRAAARIRDFVTAFQAMSRAVTRRHACPRSQHAVCHGIVDLILDGPVRSPTVGHCR
jgi:hypothetical protein